jgi:predicted amidohydrolase YtcJ
MTTWGNPDRAAAAKSAELVLVNGKIRTPVHPSGFVQAAAISGGVVLGLGGDDAIRAFVGPFTRVVNLRGRLALPAFGDAHVHPVLGGLESLRCNLVGLHTQRDYLAAIAAYCQTLPRDAWVLGGGGSMPAFPGGTPAAADLDAVTGGSSAARPAPPPARCTTAQCGWSPITSRHRARPSSPPRCEAADGGGYFRATSVKLMLDGVCETFSAAMGAPYTDGHGRRTEHSGSLFIEPDELTEATGRLADLGFQLHFHAIGDRAVSTALDALAKIPDGLRAGGRHHIAHLQFVSPPDLQRFAELGVIANFQPLWACRSAQNDQLTGPFVGNERAAWQYRIRSLLRLGSRVAFGSDWPVSSADPLQGMHVAVNRMLSARLGEPGSAETTMPLLAAEAIAVDAAVDAFTRGVAYVNHEDEHGRHTRARQARRHRRAHPGHLRGPADGHRRDLGRVHGRQRPGRPRRREGLVTTPRVTCAH